MSHSNSPSVFDVAAYILSKQRGKVSTMKMQKLLYYVQAWNLVWKDRPLFTNDFEAWANGPVCREYFCEHQGNFFVSSENRGDKEILSKESRETIDTVLAFYGKKDAEWLSNKTHEEKPWIEARENLRDGARGERIISKTAMRDYYASLS